MPYIKPRAREELNETPFPGQAGELNYMVTKLCLDYLKNMYDDQIRYDQYNEIIGVLECAKLEFYRRAVAPYEDKKKEENGDVY